MTLALALVLLQLVVFASFEWWRISEARARREQTDRILESLRRGEWNIAFPTLDAPKREEPTR